MSDHNTGTMEQQDTGEEEAIMSQKLEGEEEGPGASDGPPGNVSVRASPTQQTRQPEHSIANGHYYRQYILDRVSGSSYVPRAHRKGTRRRADNPGHGEDDEDDPTDWNHRPPHFLCYVPPCVKQCPSLMEQNVCCQALGRIGFHNFFKNRHIARRRLFSIGFVFNLLALILTCWASLAASKHHQTLLEWASFSRGEGQLENTSNVTSSEVPLLTLNIGFRALAINDAQGWLGGDQIITIDDFCDADSPAPGLTRDTLQQGLCGACRDSSRAFVLSCLFNIIMVFKNMFSDITRMYPGYDLNCPNFAGSLLATLSVFLGMYTIFAYQNRCFNNISEAVQVGERLSNATGVDNGDVVVFRFEWWRGPGLACLSLATLLRIVDALCNYIVPTPSITRKREEQEAYELEFGGEQQLGASNGDGSDSDDKDTESVEGGVDVREGGAEDSNGDPEEGAEQNARASARSTAEDVAT